MWQTLLNIISIILMGKPDFCELDMVYSMLYSDNEARDNQLTIVCNYIINMMLCQKRIKSCCRLQMIFPIEFDGSGLDMN